MKLYKFKSLKNSNHYRFKAKTIEKIEFIGFKSKIDKDIKNFLTDSIVKKDRKIKKDNLKQKVEYATRS